MGLFNRESRAQRAMEVRDPSAATQSLRWVTPGRASMPDWNASQAYSLAYYMDPIAYACVRAIAGIISGLPFRAGPDPTNRENYNPNARLAQLLGSEPPNGPCPGLGATDLWFSAVRDFLVAGRFGWEIESTPGTKDIAALWPLAAPVLKPIPSESGTAWFKGFEYGQSMKEVKLPADRVFYVWNPSGDDFRQPESALRAASLAVSVSVMQAQFDYSFLRNDARPSTVVVTEEFEDQDSFEAFKRQFGSEFAGPANAGKSMFVEATGSEGAKGAIEVIPLGVTPKDQQAQQRAEARQKEIAVALGVPWSRLDASGRTFDNASQEDEIFWRQTLIPLISRLQNAVNVQLAPRLGSEFGWFDLSAVPVLNPAPAVVATPATAPNPEPELALAASAEGEFRKMHPYHDDGSGVCECGKPAVHQAHGYFLPRAAEEIEVREPVPSMTASPAPPAPDLVPDPEVRRAKLWNTTNGRVKALERSWERALRKLFARQARSAVARLEGKRGRALVRTAEVRATADEVFDPSHWLAETVDDVTALYEAAVAAGGQRVSDLLGIAFDIEAEFAQDFIQARANQLAGQVTETTYSAIQDALRAGVAEGEGIPELAERIKHVFSVATDARATTIARTETISAFNGSASLTAASYGGDVVAGQEWIATRDSRTRDDHAERDGEVVAIGELFSGGLAYPGDPNGAAGDVVNCRCTVAFLTPDEMGERGARTVETRVAAVVLRMVRKGSEDVETGIRAALKAAA